MCLVLFVPHRSWVIDALNLHPANKAIISGHHDRDHPLNTTPDSLTGEEGKG